MSSSETEANKALVRGFFRAWSADDLDAAIALTDPDGDWWIITFGEDLRMSDWTDRIRRKRPLFRAPPRFEIDCLTAEENRVSVLARGFSTLEDGRPYDNVYHYLIECDGGRIVRGREFCDPRLSDAAFRGGERMAFAISP